MLALVQTGYANGTPNAAALHDLGMANSHLILEATALGLHGHFMGGFDAAKARELFELPAGLQPVVMLALGYLGQPEQLDEPFLSREHAPRQRRPVTDFAIDGQLPGRGRTSYGSGKPRQTPINPIYRHLPTSPTNPVGLVAFQNEELRQDIIA